MPANDVILILDPSSKCTGYALFQFGKLRECGRLKPDKAKDAANDRIRAMVRDIREMVKEYAPAKVVIEDTTGKVVSSRHKGKGAGLAIYGKAIGWIIGALEAWGVEVICVLENTWTAGRSKDDRQSRVMATYPNLYKAKQDPGQDASDAVDLGDWWIREEEIKKQRGDKR